MPAGRKPRRHSNVESVRNTGAHAYATPTALRPGEGGGAAARATSDGRANGGANRGGGGWWVRPRLERRLARRVEELAELPLLAGNEGPGNHHHHSLGLRREAERGGMHAHHPA